MSPARAWFLAVAVSAACCYPSLTGATTYMVGDYVGWAIPPNTSYYQMWAANKTFMVGDMLNFTWTGTHNVADNISKADYDGCTKVGIDLGSPGLIKIVTSGPHYYICTVGPHCSFGQKLAITVMASTPAAVTPAAVTPAAVTPSGASSTSKSIDLFPLVVFLLVLFG